jgi:REP element-mobilizing transposase RayT
MEAGPFDSPTNIVKIFKGVTVLSMSRKFLDLECKLWRGVMWSLHYVRTAGHVSAEMIERYVKDQQRAERVEARLKPVVFPVG